MFTILDQALVELDRMNTSVSAPHSVDESKAKEMLSYLKSLGFPLAGERIRKFGLIKGWNEEYTRKMAGWADKINVGERVVIKHPGQLTELFKNRLTDHL
ncbi:DUF1889 family protein [Vagococcus sp. WN89Y]|uniref:DUF1889 family protein n=1 Tax=Vagococcus sp. WN89Y TaxID=3457258 RepID=UPI003FCCBE05